jgi:hypothetical protein
MKHAFQAALTALLVISSVSSAFATTARKMSNRDLAEQSEVILIGRAVDARSAWEGRTLVTVVTVTVSERLKGDAGGTISVALPGGIDANRRIPVGMTYAGAPTIKPGEDVFLFLARDESISSVYVVMGFSQGKFSIVQEPNGRSVVTRDLTQIQLQGGTGVVRGAVSYIALVDFRDEILTYLK